MATQAVDCHNPNNPSSGNLGYFLPEFRQALSAWSRAKQALASRMQREDFQSFVRPMYLVGVLCGIATGKFNYFAEADAYFRKSCARSVLSLPDWNLLAIWENAGVPLRAIFLGIDTVIERRNRSFQLAPINGLAYCSQEVLHATRALVDASVGVCQKRADISPPKRQHFVIAVPPSNRVIQGARIASSRLAEFVENEGYSLAGLTVYPRSECFLSSWTDWEANTSFGPFLRMISARRFNKRVNRRKRIR